MKKNLIVLVIFCFALVSCTPTPNENSEFESDQSGAGKRSVEMDSADNQGLDMEKPQKAGERVSPPKDIRGYFMALPQDVFALEGCEPKKDPNCVNAKKKYLDRFLKVDDPDNGYLSAGGDGAQDSIRMAIFRKPDGTALIGVNDVGEMKDSSKFYDFANGDFDDVSLEVVPEYSSLNIYEIPRKGTTVPVYAKRVIEQGADYQVTEKGEKLYDLIWTKGEFSIKR